MRIWRKLVATKRLGQGHGIDSILTNRVPGNLIVHCPCCLEPGVNTEDGWEKTPDFLRSALNLNKWLASRLTRDHTTRHLNQIQLTVDGNFHLNKYIKNTDPDDVSLFGGKSFFPQDDLFRTYIKNIPTNAPEVSSELTKPCAPVHFLSWCARKRHARIWMS